MSHSLLELLEDEELYPSSDGKPMGETYFHIMSWWHLIPALQYLTRDLTDVFVAGNVFLYYEEGNSKARKAPDAMVIKGVPRGPRRSFKTWIEKAVPNVVFELTSKKTKKEDLVIKPDMYARIGIKEYFLFDPENAFLKPALQGFRLKQGKYASLKPASDGSLKSRELSARMIPEGSMLRFIDQATGQLVPTPQEAEQREKQRADALEAELSQLRSKQGNG